MINELITDVDALDKRIASGRTASSPGCSSLGAGRGAVRMGIQNRPTNRCLMIRSAVIVGAKSLDRPCQGSPVRRAPHPVGLSTTVRSRRLAFPSHMQSVQSATIVAAW